MSIARWALCLLSLSIASIARAGDDTEQAKGDFYADGSLLEASDAYAFPDNLTLDFFEGVVVAVCNEGLNQEYYDRMWDRKRSFDRLLRFDDVALVFFQFDSFGEYKGLRYDLGHASDFIPADKTTSTVKIKDGRIAGRLTRPRTPGDKLHFDIEIDVPIATKEYGQPLPADGGEPGQAYAAFHQALAADEASSVERLLTKGALEYASEDGPDALVGTLRKDHPQNTYQITKGFRRDDHALLLIEGQHGDEQVRTEAHLRLEDGRWKLDDELLLTLPKEPATTP